jgi:Concanavalin A-like lectin/glucanases superfamily
MLQGIPSLMVARGSPSGASTLLNGLQVYYALSDTTDSSGNGMTLTNNNSVTFTTTSTSEWFTQYGDASNGYFIRTGDTAGHIHPLLGSGGINGGFDSTSAWNDGNWHLVVVTFQRAGLIVIRVDNNADGSLDISSISGSVNNAAGFALGATADLGNWLDGSMDEFGLWNRGLTNTERTNLYNGGAGTTYPFTGL